MMLQRHGRKTMENSQSPTKSRRPLLIFTGIVSFLGLTALLSWAVYFRNIAYTDDAYVHGNLVVLTPLHEGFVTDIYTDDTFLAEKGELLVQLDETDARIRLRDAEEVLGKTIREVCQIFHRTFAYQSEINVRMAELIVAKQDWDHRIDVINAGGVSLENLQHAEAALKANFFLLKETESLYLKERAMILGTSISSNPLVMAAVEKYMDAWVRLYRCKVYSPVRGIVAERTIQVGMWVPAGTPMLSVIPLDQIWVNANYKETQMSRMKIGQEVLITADMYGLGVVYHGKIVGLPGGAGNAFSLLPPQNLSGNWIKIVQRLPVRVEFDLEELQAHPLRVGQTMRALTKLNSPNSGYVPKTTKGSPHYTTPIFEKEENGAREMVAKIIDVNMDPALKHYLNNPLEIADNETSIELDSLRGWLDNKPLSE